MFTISAKPKSPHTLEEVETAIVVELDKLKEEPVSAMELERVKNSIRMNQLKQLSSNHWLAFSLNWNFIHRGDWRAIPEDLGRQLTVTAGDIQRVVRKYFTPENQTVATLVRPTKTETTDASIPGTNHE